MFDAVKFRHFKGLADVEIPLSRLTLLVGANASGKSSVLDGLHLLCQLGAPRNGEESDWLRRPGKVFWGPRSPGRLRTWGSSGALRLEGKIGGELALAVEAEPLKDDSRFVVEFADPVARKVSRIQLSDEASGSRSFFGALDRLGFGSCVRLRLEAQQVAKFAADAEHPRVAFHGGGTAAVLAWLAEQRLPALDRIERDLATVVPLASKLIPQRAREEEGGSSGALGRLFELETTFGARIPADLLSEGTLLTIGLLTVLHRPPAPRLVLLDDFDRALHPSAQRRLVDCVKGALVENPDLQFVCTTHSPFVLDLFDADDVRVLRTNSRGETQAARLTDHPEWDSWKTTMKAGEFWTYAGEDWLESAARL